MLCLVLTKICLNKYKTLRRSENDKVFSFWHILIDLASIFSLSLPLYLNLNAATAILFAAVSCHGKPQACQGFFCASQEQQARNADKKYFTLSYNKNFITIFAVNDVEDEWRVQRVGGGEIFISLVVLFVGRFCIASPSPSPSPYVALPLSKNVKCAMHNKLDVAVEIKKPSDMGRKHGTAEAKQKQRIRWASMGGRSEAGRGLVG